MGSSSGIPSSSRTSRSKASGSIPVGSSSVWYLMSTSAEARYSVVANPWLKVAAFLILATSSSGIGSPVSWWTR